jgi:hypothetical protein
MSAMQDPRDGHVPPREAWPEPVANTDAGAVLTDLILTTCRLNARFLGRPKTWPSRRLDRRPVAGAWRHPTSLAAWQRSAAAWA